jgi:hypothetical protein
VGFVPGSVFAQGARALPDKAAFGPGRQQFSSARFQSAIRSEETLATLAKKTDFIPKESVSFGFSAKSREARFFILGTLYSQALAHLAGGDMTAAADRLKAIETEFISLQAPSSLYNYVAKTRNMVETDRYPLEVLIEFLGVFEPFLTDYALETGKDMPLLLHAGSWLNDFGLAAAADDKSLLGQSEKLNYFRDEMKRLDAPRQAVQSFDELVKITEKEKIADDDVKKIRGLVNKIQTTLD